MSPDGVGLEVAAVDFEIEPVEAKGLRQSQRSFAIVSVDAVACGLV